MAIEVRGEDLNLYLVITGDERRIDGYLGVIITLSGGFPLIEDLANIKSKNDFSD